jgi:hypothetical protein
MSDYDDITSHKTLIINYYSVKTDVAFHTVLKPKFGIVFSIVFHVYKTLHSRYMYVFCTYVIMRGSEDGIYSI